MKIILYYLPLLIIALLLVFVLEVLKVDMPFKRPLPEQKATQVQTLPAGTTFRVPILLYHYVEYVRDAKDTIRKSLDITPNIFEKQVKTLVDNGYTFLTTAQLGEVLNGKKPLPPKPIVLTFDDGYRDFYTDVFPILKKYQVKATAYIVPGFLDKPNSMSTSQVKEVAESGLVEIGAHTVHHVSLKGLPIKKASEEITESKKILTEKFHVQVVSFAYPYGAFDRQVMHLVKEAGFQTAVSTMPGVEVNEQNRFSLHRIRSGARTDGEFLNYLEKTTFKP